MERRMFFSASLLFCFLCVCVLLFLSTESHPYFGTLGRSGCCWSVSRCQRAVYLPWRMEVGSAERQAFHLAPSEPALSLLSAFHCILSLTSVQLLAFGEGHYCFLFSLQCRQTLLENCHDIIFKVTQAHRSNGGMLPLSNSFHHQPPCHFLCKTAWVCTVFCGCRFCLSSHECLQFAYINENLLNGIKCFIWINNVELVTFSIDFFFFVILVENLLTFR